MKSFVFVLALMGSGNNTEVATFQDLAACERESTRINQTLSSSGQVAICLPQNTNTTEVSLRIVSINGALNYSFGSSEYKGAPDLTVERALAPVPAADLTAGQWVQLSGVYDGTHWRLYRNGTEIAASAGTGKAIAATVRADAAKLSGTAQMLRLAESLVYEDDAATHAQVDNLHYLNDGLWNLRKVS